MINISYNEFVQKVKELDIQVSIEYDRSKLKHKEIKDSEYIKIEWTGENDTGYANWGDASPKDLEHNHSIIGVDEPDFDDLDAILEFFYPDISYLKYKKLSKLICKEKSYYGKTITKSIKLIDVYDFLKSC